MRERQASAEYSSGQLIQREGSTIPNHMLKCLIEHSHCVCYTKHEIQYPVGRMLRQNVQKARRLLMWGPAILSDETIPMDGHQSRNGNLVGTADSLDGR